MACLRYQSSTKMRIAAERLVRACRVRSMPATTAATLDFRAAAISVSARQNGSSSETLVRWPAIVSERLVNCPASLGSGRQAMACDFTLGVLALAGFFFFFAL